MYIYCTCIYTVLYVHQICPVGVSVWRAYWWHFSHSVRGTPASLLVKTRPDRYVSSTYTCMYMCSSQLSSSLLFQNLWFPTFDRVHDLQRKYKNSRNQKLIDCMSMPQSNCTMCNKLNNMLQKISEPVACYMYIMFVLSSTCVCTVMYCRVQKCEDFVAFQQPYNYVQKLYFNGVHVMVHCCLLPLQYITVW